MLDLSLHVLDIVENAVRAGASSVHIQIVEDRHADLLTLTIEDDGEGMDEATLEKAADPFFTTKSGKKTGLGLSLLAQSAEEAGGQLRLRSRKGVGTKVTATFRLSHIDLRPLGDMETTLRCLRVAHPEIEFQYKHLSNGGQAAASCDLPLTPSFATRRGKEHAQQSIPPPYETVDKQLRPSIRREKNAATRGERTMSFRKNPGNPFAPSRPRFFWGRIEGLSRRRSTDSYQGGGKGDVALGDVPATTNGLIIRVRGTVQGVGFRQFVYRLATEEGLHGFVRNTPSGVEIRVEGENRLQSFCDRLRREMPPLARIDEMEIQEVHPLFLGSFRIDATRCGGSTVFAPADLFMCDACRAELQDPNDRRYRYPFINCTDCGPRYTLLLGLPYDREKTTMRVFPMCPACKAEYESPTSRRFHAEPNACPVCGPALSFSDASEPAGAQGKRSSPASPAGEDKGEGTFLSECSETERRNASVGESEPSPQPSPAGVAGEGQEPVLPRGEQVRRMPPIESAVAAIRAGTIVAVKSLGGFHLVCDPFQPAAVARLRELKQRTRKPLALMARDATVAEELVRLDPDELRVLTSPQRPVVLLRKKREIGGLSPGLGTYGLMLPYTPLHSLLLHEIPLLVATSANEREGPILKDEGEEVATLADGILTHNRPIANRCDDSVVRVFRGAPLFLRRARGYVPDPLWLPGIRKPHSILALGAEMKSTISLLKDGYLITSQYLGDMKDLRNLTYMEESLARFRDLFAAEPTMVCCDLHPAFTTTRLAERTGKPVIRVQHHIAHVFAVMAEHGLDPRGTYLGVAFDGMGYGDDGHIWGGEFFALSQGRAQQRWHLRYVPQPGGDLAAREPWRMALSYVRDATGEISRAGVLGDIPGKKLQAVARAIEVGLNAPLTSSVGRLFDAVSALLGTVPGCVDYEAEAAMRLECAVDPAEKGGYSFSLSGDEIDVREMIREILRSGDPLGVAAAKFHNTLASIVARVAELAREKHGIDRVLLSGGVFLNAALLEKTVTVLEEKGFVVHYPRQFSPGDEAISAGQALYAATVGD